MLAAARRGLDRLCGRRPWNPTYLPPSEPARHGWADLLALVGAIRRLAYDLTIAPEDAMRRIRDVFADYDAGRRTR
jgi:hypothetical protein